MGASSSGMSQLANIPASPQWLTNPAPRPPKTYAVEENFGPKDSMGRPIWQGQNDQTGMTSVYGGTVGNNAMPSSGGKGGIAGQVPQQTSSAQTSSSTMKPLSRPEGQSSIFEYAPATSATSATQLPYLRIDDPQLPNAGQYVEQNPYQGQNVFNQASSGLTSAMGATQREMTYQPERITAGGVAQDALGYANPFENQVVGNALGDIERARQMQENLINAQATKAGAFGGSRQALMQSELGRNALEQAAKTGADLRMQGWQNAQNLASQAAQSNQSAGLAGAGQRLSAAGQMGSLSNLGFGMGQQANDMQMQAGNISQLMSQALIDAAKGQYSGYTGAPGASLGYMTSAIGATPTVGSTNKGYTPGLFDYLRLGMSF